MIRQSMGLAWVLGALVVGASTVASAQSFRLDRFRSAERVDDGFAVRRMSPLGDERFGFSGVLDYANDPFVITTRGQDGRVRRSVVHNELVLKVDVSLSLADRVLIFAGVDAPLWMEGSPPPAGSLVRKADGAGMGDLGFGLRLRLLGEDDDVFAMGLSAGMTVPTAGPSSDYRGEEGAVVRPELIFELRPKGVRLTGNAGFLVRAKQAQAYRTPIDHELVYGVLVGVPVHPRFEFMGEWFGGLRLKDPELANAVHMEWLLGAKANASFGMYVGAAAGTGFAFARAPGDPDARAVLQIGYLTPQKPPPPPPPPPPAVPAPPSDTDADGVLDDVDRCVSEPEDRDGFEDEDGCPDPDNDGDGLLDGQDQCPGEAEDVDDFEDEDGCPDLDNDGDGIPDIEDACPHEAGVPEEEGCKAKVEIKESGEISIDEQILFASGKDTILEQSFGILQAVAKLFEAHGELKRVRIEGHTDSEGPAGNNLRLSRRRARSVGVWLMGQGVSSERLQAFGCGERHPIADNDSVDGRALNRRVVFQVVDPEPSDPSLANAPVGCRPIKLGVVKMK